MDALITLPATVGAIAASTWGVLHHLRRGAMAATTRAVALQVVGRIIPTLEGNGYLIVRKRLSLGRNPGITCDLVSNRGLWAHITVNEGEAFYRFHSTGIEDGDALPDLTHRFEVTGPWDDINAVTIGRWHVAFDEWRKSGGRVFGISDQPADFVSHYQPQTCSYERRGGPLGSIGNEGGGNAAAPRYRLMADDGGTRG